MKTADLKPGQVVVIKPNPRWDCWAGPARVVDVAGDNVLVDDGVTEVWFVAYARLEGVER